ncbi:MAG: arabinogalactan endo-1,4-beta-galactosidase [Saprospiraceae bacterium]|jgi:arabinogalactan endo-1,4-beta-galactosidase
MEDCGVVYKENETATPPYEIFANNGCNLVRLRLWHSPKWYDSLNDGNRYSDLADVKNSIAKAKANGMQVLLDFHLSDNWADPNKQLVPEAWLPVVDDTEILKDSLYNYMLATLMDLNAVNLLPEMIQIGNETNKGILLSPEDNMVWTLDWNRNTTLFNSAIDAVDDFEQQSGKDIKTVLHVADPDNAEWLIDGFITNGVTDFDIIGLSYYWAWHQPTTIEGTGEVIEMLRNLYPDKQVMVVETGYIWTTDFNDNASNIITSTHPDFSPASPTNQRDWLIELTQEVINSDGMGVIYWEPAWVSSPCFTQWGQGSHQEHAAFFDFDNNLLLPGGSEFMTHGYDLSTDIEEKIIEDKVQILSNSFSGDVKIKQLGNPKKLTYLVADSLGKIMVRDSFSNVETTFKLSNYPLGMYVISVEYQGAILETRKVIYGE